MKRRGRAVTALGVALVVLLAACDSSSESKAKAKPPAPPAKSAIFKSACAGTVAASTPGQLATAEMGETSGLAVSAENSGTLWANNDSGDIARVFAISPAGALLGIYPLTGATAVDWEDLAIGPGPEPRTPYLYAGDIGDNAEARPNIVVYRVAEPKVVGDAGTYPLDGCGRAHAAIPRRPARRRGAHGGSALG